MNLCRLVAAVLAILTLVTLLAACTPVPVDGTATIVVESGGEPTVFAVNLGELEGGSAYDALCQLRDEGKLTFESSDSGYGAFLTEIGGIKPDATAGEYICIWTSYEADWDVSEYVTERDYNGTALASSGLGISSMHLADGVVVYIGLAVWAG